MSLSTSEQGVVESIRGRADRMVSDLSALVAMPTGCGHGAGLEAARTFMSARLAALGARVDRRAGGVRPDWLREGASGGDAADVLVADRSHGGTGLRLLIAGHLDTVHDPAGSFKELSAAVGGASTGPGAADMKGGLIVALTALEALHEAGVAVRWTFVLNADEETGSFASAPILADLARSADVGLVVEPAFGAGDFVTTRPGSAQFLIEAFGREAHAGRDAAKGISAVAALCKAVTRVLEKSDPAAGLTLNIGPLEGGRATNIVPGSARAWGNARYRTQEQRKAIDALLASLESGDAEHLPWVRTRVIHNRPAKPATDRVEAIATIAVRAAADLGMQVGCVATGGVSDANVLQAQGLPCLDGLGVRGGNLHRTDEFVIIESLPERAAIFALLIVRLAGLPSVPSKP